MSTEKSIPLNLLCTHYSVEMTFFSQLNELGLIEIITVEESQFIPEDSISDLEKIIRLHQELNLNPEGIDIVFHLLNKIEELQNELSAVRNRLGLYETFPENSRNYE